MGRYDWEEKQLRRETGSSGGISARWLIGLVAVGLLGAVLFIGHHDGFTGSSAAPPPAAVDALVAPPAAAPSPPQPDKEPASEQPVAFKPVQADAADSVDAHFARCTQVRVTCVVDGDTFWLNGVKIRVADYDAPEISEPHCPSELALGQRATDRFIELLNQGPFQLAVEGSRDEDRYGRSLRVVMRGGKSVGDALVAEGLAHPWVGHKLPWCR